MRYWLFILISFWCVKICALSYSVSQSRVIVGQIKSIYLEANDDYSSLAQRFDIGYYGLYEANPGVDPDNPYTGTYLIIPTKYILPRQLNYRRDNIVVNLAEMRLYYYSKIKQRVFTFPIGIGKEGWSTPTGKFTIAQKIQHPVWLVPKSIQYYRKQHGYKVAKIVQAGPHNPMGAYALRLSNPAYLIHGTDDPVGIGRRSSAGCIRMYPKDIKQLFGLVHKGMPVIIINQPYKTILFNKHFYFEAHMPLFEQRQQMHGGYQTALLSLLKFAPKDVNKSQMLQVMRQHIGIPVVV